MQLFARIATKPIQIEDVIMSVSSRKAGGTAVFIGTVRNSSEATKNVTAMELDAAVDMAQEDLARIAKAAAKKSEILKIAVTHRIGKLRVGDVIVVIAVSAPHRKDAFSACRFIIDGMKRSTPIWKKEFSGEKGRWVEPAGRFDG